MQNRTVAIIRKESLELVRDPIYLGLALIVPTLLMLLFGYGLSMDVKHLPIVFVDFDRSAQSREYINSYINSEYFELVGIETESAVAQDLMQRGHARLVVEIPPDFGHRLNSFEPTIVGVTIDGSFPSRAQVSSGYVSAINAMFNQTLLAKFTASQPQLGLSLTTVTAAQSIWYNPSLESKNFIVPGMMVILLLLFPALLGAMLIVREKEEGTIFNFYCAPVKRWEIIAGKAIPYIAVAFAEFLILFAMSIWLFDTRFTGNGWALSLCALLYAACTIGIGMLISALTRSQLAAMLLTFLTTVTPAFNYSGFLAPVASQDAVGQVAAKLIPATYFMDVVRGSYLKGLGFQYYWPQLATLALYCAAVYVVIWLVFQKRVG